MYFQHENGTFEVVSTSGGMTMYVRSAYSIFKTNTCHSYYFTEQPMAYGQRVPLQAFPKDFRMIAGMSTKRAFFGPTPDPDQSLWTDTDKTQQSMLEKSLGFNCMGNSKAPEPSLFRHEMPTREVIAGCMEGIRAEIQFPSCWDGKNVDSDNHTTHVAYPNQRRTGECPEGYDARLPTLFYETIYNTQHFIGIPGQFLFAQGDVTGNGYHADFINGWEEGVLQQAIEKCANEAGTGLQEACPVFDIKPESEVVSCRLELPEEIANEAVNGVDELPGGCLIETGVEWSPNCGKPGNAQSSSIDTTSQLSETSSTTLSTVVNPETLSNSTSISNSTTSTPSVSDAPSPSPVLNEQTHVHTSSATVSGTIMAYVVVEETITTTMVVEGTAQSSSASPTNVVKRHGHSHLIDGRAGKLHGHGASISRKKRGAFW